MPPGYTRQVILFLVGLAMLTILSFVQLIHWAVTTAFQ